MNIFIFRRIQRGFGVKVDRNEPEESNIWYFSLVSTSNKKTLLFKGAYSISQIEFFVKGGWDEKCYFFLWL